MARSRELGMRTFDWALFELYNEGHISYEEAIRNADSANELRLAIKLKSERGEPAQSSGLALSFDGEPVSQEKKRELEDRELEAMRLAKQRRLEEAVAVK